MPDNQKERLFSRIAEVTQKIRKDHAETTSAIKPVMENLYRDIKEQGKDASNAALLVLLYTGQRLQSIKDTVIEKVSAFGAKVGQYVKQLQQHGISLGLDAGIQQVEQTAPSPKNYLEQFLTKFAPLVNLFAGYGMEAADKIADLITTAIITDQDIDGLRNGVDDALQTPLYRALITAKNEALKAFREAVHFVYENNSQRLRGWVWVAILDKKTCAACVVMHGTKHSLTEKMDSHVSCRCSQVPIFVGAPPPPIKPGEEWFKQQPEDIQIGILGHSKFLAWKQKKFALADIVGHAHNPIWGASIFEKSLKQLLGGVQ